MFFNISLFTTVGDSLELINGQSQKEFIFFVMDLNCENIEDLLEKVLKYFVKTLVLHHSLSFYYLVDAA